MKYSHFALLVIVFFKLNNFTQKPTEFLVKRYLKNTELTSIKVLGDANGDSIKEKDNFVGSDYEQFYATHDQYKFAMDTRIPLSCQPNIITNANMPKAVLMRADKMMYQL